MKYILTVGLGKELYLAIQEAAKADNRSMASFVRHVLSQAVPKVH